ENILTRSTREKLFKDKIKAWGLSKNLKKISEANEALGLETPPELLDEHPRDLIFDNDVVQGLAPLPSKDVPDTMVEPWIGYQWGYAGNQALSGKTERNGYHPDSQSLANTRNEILSRLDRAFAKIEELELRMEAYHG
ncbi:MAG: hypothetical protein Q9187_004867, partial [Circinaria calcarea]